LLNNNRYNTTQTCGWVVLGKYHSISAILCLHHKNKAYFNGTKYQSPNQEAKIFQSKCYYDKFCKLMQFNVWENICPSSHERNYTASPRDLNIF